VRERYFRRLDIACRRLFILVPRWRTRAAIRRIDDDRYPLLPFATPENWAHNSTAAYSGNADVVGNDTV